MLRTVVLFAIVVAVACADDSVDLSSVILPHDGELVWTKLPLTSGGTLLAYRNSSSPDAARALLAKAIETRQEIPKEERSPHRLDDVRGTPDPQFDRPLPRGVLVVRVHARPGKTPLGIAFTLDDAAHEANRVPPQAARDLEEYWGR